VQTVLAEGPMTIIRYESADVFKEITEQEYYCLTPDIRERECEIKYQKFAGMVNSKPLLSTSPCCRGCCKDTVHNISFHSENYCELDMSDENASLYFNPNIPILKVCSVPPRAPRSVKMPVKLKEPTASPEDIEQGKSMVERGKTLKREVKSLIQKVEANKILGKLKIEIDTAESLLDQANILSRDAVACFKTGKSLQKLEWTIRDKTTEMPGDLICGVLNPRNKDRFQFWFIASDQFFRFYQIVMHDNQHPGTRLAKLNNRQTILSGSNSLCTNTFKKRTMMKRALEKQISVEKEKKSTVWIEMMESDDKIQALEDLVAQLDSPVYWTLRSEKISRDFCHLYPALVLVCIYKELPRTSNVPGDHEKWILPDWVSNIYDCV
jgi:hypothetical protein